MRLDRTSGHLNQRTDKTQGLGPIETRRLLEYLCSRRHLLHQIASVRRAFGWRHRLPGDHRRVEITLPQREPADIQAKNRQLKLHLASPSLEFDAAAPETGHMHC
ncbi:hypothetical protein [Pseudomonas tohonis]|uniref:hypothetical protein n=1 Tax=Pseudomonas tohonis TaxID=2725477 RepID=UPI0021D9FF3D|nr:hypothetical protein [Pseudomonas tohonis]UXY55084.1 hypothetical protein N9L84_11115 [Pseudomonas tohonis]